MIWLSPKELGARLGLTAQRIATYCRAGVWVTWRAPLLPKAKRQREVRPWRIQCHDDGRPVLAELDAAPKVLPQKHNGRRATKRTARRSRPARR